MNEKNKAQLSSLTGQPVEREQKNFKTISSREVAEMMGVVRHSDMLEKIDRIDEIYGLNEAKEIIDNQGHSVMSFGLVRAIVKEFCERGSEFSDSLN